MRQDLPLENPAPQTTALGRFLLHPFISMIRVPQFALAIAIFYYMALMPAGDAPSKYPDELLHFVGNFLLICSGYLAMFNKVSLIKTLSLCLVLSVIAELCQNLTASRVADPADLVVNILGLGLGYLASRGFQLVVKLGS